MFAEASTSTAEFLAFTALPPMLADPTTTTLLAQVLAISMRTDAGTSTLLATVLVFSMRTQVSDHVSASLLFQHMLQSAQTRTGKGVWKLASFLAKSLLFLDSEIEA